MTRAPASHDPVPATAAGATLVEALSELLGRPAKSFQLMGEDLALVPGARLAAATEAYRAGLTRVPAALRERFEAEQAALLRESHAMLVRHNRSVHGRLT